MEKSNQQPKTESCSAEGSPVDLKHYRTERQLRSVLREKREPQARPASGLSNSASKGSNVSGDGVMLSVSKTEATVQGEVAADLPGFKSVASVEGNTRNEGGPASPCRTNC